jgi:O-antigen biosynthesis protein
VTATRPRVHIVLATFEPRAEWLREQVSSILGQTGVDVTLHLADDGSGAATLALLRALCAEDPRCSWNTGPRIGSAQNFGRGLGPAPRDVDAVLLSDQDDVWDVDKSAALVAMLDEGHVLAHSDARLIDAEGRTLSGTLFAHEQRDSTATTQAALVVRNVVTGCTLALRPALLDAALPFPSVVGGPVHHDLWLALCAAGVGTIGTVSRPLLSYRQHGANVVGAVAGYGRWHGLRDAIGSWALRRRIAVALTDVAATGRLPQPDPDVTVWTGARAELASRSVLRRLATEHPGMRPLARTLRVGALGHLALRLVRAPLAEGSRVARIVWRGLRLLGFIVRNPKRMLGGIARSAGVVDRPLRTVSATPHDPQQRPLRARVTGPGRTVHLLIPGVSPSGVFGGVGTAVALGVALAEAGERVQLVMTDYGQSIDDATVRGADPPPRRHESGHARPHLHRPLHPRRRRADPRDRRRPHRHRLVDRSPRRRDDRHAHPDLRRRSIVYLVQDDETLFYEASERRLMAEASYRLDALHVVNSTPLAEHLRDAPRAHGRRRAGPRATRRRPARRSRCARSTAAARDRLRTPERGTQPLRHGAARGRDVGCRAPHAVSCARSRSSASASRSSSATASASSSSARPGVLSWDAYLELLATAHLGVSLMASPHPSYPPLEMAASGLVVVTNRWGPKDLGALSERLVTCAPDATDVARALALAEERHEVGGDPTLDLSALGRPLEAVAATLQERIVAR